MTDRERTLRTLTYTNPDRLPFVPGGPRKSTLERWRAEGLPDDAPWFEYVCEKIGMPRVPDTPSVPQTSHVPRTSHVPGFSADLRMRPQFEEKILEHRNGHYIIQDWMGSILEIDDKYDYTYIRNAIDFVTRRWIKCPVTTPDDWREMKRRYDPAAPGRVTELTRAETESFNARETFYALHVNGPFWQLREWMGFEGLCAAFIEQPDFVADMIEFWRCYVLRIMQIVFERGVVPDCVHISEDMAYKAHSMISPAMTREFLLPTYRAWSSYAKANGVPLIDMDSDGYVAELIPIWIEAGISVCDPIEAAAHNDIVLYSKTYGDRMAYRGGIDKRAIAAGGRAIEDELQRLAPVIDRAGGFIPSCDHGVPNDVSLTNFVYYAKLLAGHTGWI